MRSTKQILTMLLSLVICLSLLPATAKAESGIIAAEEDSGTIAAVTEKERAGEIVQAEETEQLEEEGETADTFFAASGTCGDNVKWTLSDGGKLTIKGTGPMTDFQYNNCPWIDMRDQIKSVVISSGVTTAGQYAFWLCDNLVSVSIADTVTTIGYCAFADCPSLISVTIPASVTKMWEGPFTGCTSLTEIIVESKNPSFTILNDMLVTKDKKELIQVPGGLPITSCKVPSGITVIWGEAFGNNNLTSITLPASVRRLDTTCFMNCRNLTKISVASSSKSFSSEDGVLYSKDKTKLYFYPQGKDIPASYTVRSGVTTIGKRAFFGRSFSSVVLPAGVTTIDDQAFSCCDNLTTVVIPDSLTEVCFGAFGDSNNLQTVYYTGTKEQWKQITIEDYNEPLKDAKIIYGLPKINAPVLNSVGIGTDSLTINWNAVSDAEKYQVQRKSDGDWEMLKTVTALSYTDATPKMGTNKYRVRAYGLGTWSAWSNAMSAAFNPFTDVSTSDTIFKYVSWAYNNDIVTGTSDTTFSPGNTCTRIQFIMMLWKMHGSPVVGGTNPFSDIEDGTRTCKAILWALDKGIINSGSTFNPKGSVTRINIVMMLWKLAGSPKASGTNPFTDVSGAKTINAVLWAYSNGITKGTSATTFSPNKNCTRGQLVTFLYKYNNIYNVI